MTTATVQIFDGPGKPLRPERISLPTHLTSGELLIGIELATICGSDLHTLAGLRTEPTPCVLGHEAVGRVVASGGGRAEIEVGARVTWSIADSCGTCLSCTRYDLPEKCHRLFKYGHAALADGTGLNGCYATHVLLRPGTRAVRIGEHLPAGIMATANCAMATAVNVVSHIPATCRTAVIQGTGLLGIYACALLRERGMEQVFCVDVRDERLARVEEFGGIPVDGRPARYPDDRRRIERAVPHGIDAVVEVAGTADLVPEGIDLLRPGGIYLFAGMVHPGTRLDLTGEQVIRKCLTLRGVHNYAPRHLEEAVAFLEETAERYPYASLVSSPFPLGELEQAVQTARNRQHFRVAVRP